MWGGGVVRAFLRRIGVLFRRSRLNFLNENVDVSVADGPAAMHIHVQRCLNAASVRRFPWVSGFSLRKCKPLTDGPAPQSAEERPGQGYEIVHKIREGYEFLRCGFYLKLKYAERRKR